MYLCSAAIDGSFLIGRTFARGQAVLGCKKVRPIKKRRDDKKCLDSLPAEDDVQESIQNGLFDNSKEHLFTKAVHKVNNFPVDISVRNGTLLYLVMQQPLMPT